MDPKPGRSRGPAPAASKRLRATLQPRLSGNPFEVKVNKQKFSILGKKSRHEVGLPGLSRSRAIQKRTATLLKEHKQRGRSSVFRDKRFGEYDTKLTPEEKMMKRFALERQRNHDKKNMYNLNEDEELTHFGQSLADIEKLNDVVDSDSENEERGALSAELTAAHFGGGGGLLRKKDPSDERGETAEKPKSRKDLIEELIAKSKLDKRERQTQKENTIEMTEKLDNDWKAIQGLLGHKVPKSERKAEIEEKPKPDEYDIIVRQLGFEMKAQPSDRMKTQDELAKEEEERLQQLEAERLRRMLGEDEDGEKNLKKLKHLSADDLMDGFILDKEDRQLLSYKDGKLTDGQDEDESSNEDGSENEEEDMKSDDENEEAEGDDGREEEESDATDEHSDLESDPSSDEETVATKLSNVAPKAKPKKLLGDMEKKAEIEAAKAELPYTFAAPESYEDLKSLLLGKPAEHQLIVLERIQKCNHPSLAVGNKAKLQKLFGFLLEYIGELSVKNPQQLGTVDKMTVHLYELCQMFPEAASDSLRSVFRDAAHDIDEILELKGHAKFPSLELFIYLKITAILFPTSDFWHPVVTPALTYLSQLLIKCPVLSLENVAAGLFLCCVFIEYVSLSKRFAPELINFLLGILHLAVPSKGKLGYNLVHPFKPLGKNSELLLVSSKKDTETWEKTKIPLHAVIQLKESSETEKNHFRLSCVALCLDLVQRCVSLYGQLPAFKEMFHPIQSLLAEHLPVGELPKKLQDFIQDILKEVQDKEKCDAPLVFEKKKPVPLKLYTPKIMEILDFGKKQGSSREEREKKRLIHKHKREFKGAVREIRRDTQFLARQQISEIMERDTERKRKVKQLFNSLSTQEGEWKAMKKKKMKGRAR